jgi:hypothetical protein
MTKNEIHGPPNLSVVNLDSTIRERTATAVVYCEGNFGAIDGKTANGLVRRSERYEILSVIDSEKAGLDAGTVLDGEPNAIPICRDLAEALEMAATLPDYFIFGMAPSSGMLSLHERGVVLEAITRGMNIVNGLHEFLGDDPVFKAACMVSNVEIFDVRRPPAKKDLHMFTGDIAKVTCPVIAVLGTDCAIGKRTTATILSQARRAGGVESPGLFDFVVYSSWRLSRWRCVAACAGARDSLRFPGDGHANAGYGDNPHRDVRQDHGNRRDDKP